MHTPSLRHGRTGWMRTAWPLLTALLLAACAGGPGADRLSSTDPNIQMGRAALAGGAPALALNAGTTVLNEHPRDPEGLALQADALSALGRGNEAVPVYRQLLALDPKSVNGHIGLGRVLLASDPAEAEREFLIVLTLAPDTAVAANNLGIARDLQGHHLEAQAAYRRALGLAPSLQAASVNLALSLGMSGHAADAVPLLRPLVEASSADAKLRQNLAAALAMSGQRDSAARLLSRDMAPNEVQAALDRFVALTKE